MATQPAETFNITTYCLKPHLIKRPDKAALILIDAIDQQQSFTYAELYQAICRLTTGLKSLQLPKSSVVAIRASQPLDLLFLFLSAMAADLVPIPTLSSLTQDEFEWIINDSNSALVFQLGDSKIPSLKMPKACRLVEDEQYQTLKTFQAENLSPTTSLNDPAFIFYTSGSSGNPKGVLHAHHSILGRKPSLQEWLPLRENDRVMHTDNICWTYSMFTGVLDPFTVGATSVIFTPSNQTAVSEDQIPATIWLDLIRHYLITVLVSSPDIYSRIIQIPHVEHLSIPTLRLAGSAGSPLSENIRKKWVELFKLPIYTALGMSELSIFICEGPAIPPKENRIGKIQSGRKVTILPIEGDCDPVPPQTMGILAIHKTELGLMIGYIGDSKSSSNYRGDWFLTQDLVSRDEDDYLTYYGRLDTILKVGGGFRVSPLEIENMIKKCPKVIDVACDVILDPEKQIDCLVAYLVSQDPSKETAEEVHNLLSQHLSDYKIPQLFYFVEKLPRNNRGKLQRRALKQLSPFLKASI